VVLLSNSVPLLPGLALILVLAAPEAPMRPEAQALYDQAMSLYSTRKYPEAIRLFEAAYAIDPKREILFGQAQATRLAGDCAAALPLYQRFLATDPPPQQVEATRIAAGRCEAAVNIRPPPPPPPVIVTPPPPPPASPRWYADARGGLLVGAGVVGIGVGVALLSSAASANEEAAKQQDHLETFGALKDRAQRRWAWGMGALVAGSALVAGGVGRYLWISVGPGRVEAGGRF
jgi:tetratricopeptide (TPR) repeat protein